ncbi:RNA polymerase sigma factor [Lewinella cohaerens]|uniref:RNA polymerase sigma factor n=1 Tax=Lewinella cohaerens TaxID=70995 RepID=UPI00035C4923|nr:sigma-70 family RNA polymerase sigma factor [Lewinella cohaerens]
MDRPRVLLKSIEKGDQAAFRELYDLYSKQVYNTALSYAQNPDDAKEIAQDVFTNVFRKADTFRSEAKVSTWIYRITINTSLNFLKRKKRVLFLSIDEQHNDQPDFDHPGVLLENREAARSLFRTINTLAEQQKTAFILSYVDDLPRQEVADIMGVSLKAVESLLHRAKKNLRTRLASEYPNRKKR